MAIPKEIYEAAAIDGATGIQQTVHVTFPLMANVYLVATLLSTLWTFGDFPTVYFVSSGAPARTTDVWQPTVSAKRSTLAIRSWGRQR